MKSYSLWLTVLGLALLLILSRPEPGDIVRLDTGQLVQIQPDYSAIPVQQ